MSTTNTDPPAQASEPNPTVVRLKSGILAFAVVLPIFLSGRPSLVGALAYAAALWGLHEMVSMTLGEERKRLFPLAIAFGTPIFLLSATSTGWLSDVLPAAIGTSAAAVGVGILTLLGTAIWFLFTASTTDGLADRWARFLLALAYVPGTVGILPALTALPGGRGWLWAPLFAAWCGDIGAYFAGRAFGGPKMSPLISPKKTWSGFFGGMALAVVGIFVQKFLFFGTLTIIDCIAIGLLGFVAGVVGDLVESMIKRSYGHKDSGTFLPGHGGMLDRIDSVMFALPVVWVWVVLIRPFVVQ